MSEGTQRMAGGVSGAEDPPVSVASGVGASGVTTGDPYQGTGNETTTTYTSTETYPGAVTTDTGGSGAGSVTEQAADSSRHVAGVARDQAAGVTSEASHQAKKLLGQARGEVHGQASTQQQRLAGSLRSIGQELSSMSDRSEQSGPATQLTRQASEYTHQAADWLEQRDPGQVLDEVRRFARRRPGTFLAVAAVTGLVAGRLTRGIASASHDSGQGDRQYGNGYGGERNGGQYGNGYSTGQYSQGQYSQGQYSGREYGAGTGLPERTATVPPAVDVREMPATGTPTGTLGAEEYGSGLTDPARDEPLR